MGELSMGRKRSLEIKQKCKMVDARCDKIYQKFVSTFTGRVCIKLISEIVLACLIAAAVYLATEIYNDSRAEVVDNKKCN